MRVGYKYTEGAGSLSGQNLSNKKEGTEEENKTKQSVSENRLISWSDWSVVLSSSFRTLAALGTVSLRHEGLLLP